MDLSKFGKDFANKKSMNLTGLAITSEQLKAKKEQKEASTIFDIELTPNRADRHSIIGMCREAASALGQEFKAPSIREI